MKHFRSMTALLLALMLLLVPFAGVFAEDEPEAEWIQLPLGTSGYSLRVPAGYTDLGVSDDDFELGGRGSFSNPDTKIGIDVNQCEPAQEGFKEFSEALCAGNGGTGYTFTEYSDGPVATAFYFYDENAETPEENSEGYHTSSLLIDTGEVYVEVNFWGPMNEEADALVLKMAGTLGKTEKQYIRLGSSPYVIAVPEGYYQGDVTSEEAARGLIAYYLNDAMLFDFDIYENIVDADLTLADVATQLCAADQGTDLKEHTVNDIPVYTFNGHDEYNGVEYDTVTMVLDSSNGSFIAVVCWLDNEAMRPISDMLLASVMTEDQIIPDEFMTLRIGSSDYAITLPTTFVKGYVSEEDFQANGYAACYYSPYALFDIDLYQYLTSDVQLTLAEFTEKDAANYEGTEIALDDEINGVNVTSYRSVETYDDIEYKCLSYAFADDEYIYQLCFYYTDEDAAEDIEAVMASLAPIEKTTLQLGSYALTVPAGLTATPIEYDEPELTATAYKLEPLKFTVYEMNIPEKPYTLEQVAEQEVAYYNGTNFEFVRIGDIRVAAYLYTKTDEQYNQYKILTYCLETDTGYMDIDFEIGDYVGMFQALEVMGTLTRAQ